MNCITQQQPASGRFAEACGWSKVTVAAQVANLYSSPIGGGILGSVRRLSSSGRDVYLERLSTLGRRVRVRVSPGGEVGWIDQDALESAGERCPGVYTLN